MTHVAHASANRILTVAITVLLVSSASPALGEGGGPLERTPTVSVEQVVDRSCVRALSDRKPSASAEQLSRVCTFRETMTVSAPSLVTPTDILEVQDSLSAREFGELQTAVNAGTVRSKTFRRTYDNLVVAWSQSGRFYYDGSRVWVRSTYRGYTGYHSCTVDRAIGYVIERKACDESGSTSKRDLRAIFHSSSIPSGGLVNWDTEWHTYVNAAGSVWW